MAVLALALVSACTAPPPPATMNDPNEVANREVHDFNTSVDRALLRPASGTYGTSIPAPVKQGISNFSDNLGQPGNVLNGLLQGRPQNALENTLRFAINTTVGIGGLFDPARAIGLPGRKTDFGETLHVWGAGEGTYVVLPFIGPSTERDTVGAMVDFAINPLQLLLPRPESYVGPVAKIASRLGDRSQYSDTLDSVLYDSADGYAQTRLLYLQNRRFELGQAPSAEDAYLDPYEDPNAQ
ncbi:VacJ family lipoprotein [Paracoccaceae bacterium Fryx2]|nr:VacJ family lipoprotein [Paracoccaceae bacterium Fryx2]